MTAEPSPASAGEEPDLLLARRIASGNRAAFEVLMRRYNRRLYRLARALMHNETEAKDALQEAYVSAYRSIGRFRGESALATWLSRLVLNECTARQRRAARRENIIPLLGGDLNSAASTAVADTTEAPDRFTAREQIRSVLERKVGELPDSLRVVFVLRSVEEMSVAQIAETLAISHEAVRSRHFRAKGMLRESLAREIDLAERDVFDFGGAHCDSVVTSVLARL